jgi:drug/metabolite transporter (DMT)-like permease
MSRSYKAIIAVVFANFFFGTTVIAVKHITPSIITPVALTTVRVVATACLFWLFFGFTKSANKFTRKDFLILMVCALMGISFNQGFSIKGMSLTSPIHASLLILTTPISISLLAALFLKEKLTPYKLGGLLLGITGGAILIFSRDLSVLNSGDQTKGDLFVMLSALCYSTYVLIMKSLSSKYPNLTILKWVFLIGACISLPFGWQDLQKVPWHNFDTLSWFCLFYIVVGATFLSYLFMNYGISQLGASRTSSFMYSQPFFAAVSAIILLNERISLSKILAASLIFTGVYLANLTKNFSEKE